MKTLIALVVVLLYASPSSAITLYAKAAGGNWSAAATWSNFGCAGFDSSGPPTDSDDVVIEACSGEVVMDTIALGAHTVSIGAGGRLSASTDTQVSIGLIPALSATVWSADPASVVDVSNLIMTIGVGGGATTTFAGGGQRYGETSFAYFAGIGTIIVTGSNTFTTVHLTTPGLFAGAAILSLEVGSTQTLDNLTDDAPVIGYYSIVSSTPGMPTLLSKSSGVVNTAYTAVTDTTTTGGATWCASYASADGGGNSGWAFVACPYEPLQSLTGVGR